MSPRRLFLAFHQISLLILVFAGETKRDPTSDTRPVRDYRCSSNDEAAFVREAKSNLKRFVRHREKLYFVFENSKINKIIFTKLPTLQKDESNRSFFIHYDFHEQIIDASSVSTKVIGHVYDGDAMQEIHSTSQSGKLCASEKTYELGFSEELAKRDHQVNLNAELLRHLNNKRACKSSYIEILKNKNMQVIFGLNEQARRISVELGVDNDFKEAFRLNFSENVRFFVVPKFENEADSFIFDLIWVDETAEINYESYVVQKPNPGLIEKKTQFKASLDELLSCHTRATNARQFKGIYFDRATEKFYVFINRFYLKLDRDLVSTFFMLTDLTYARHAQELEYGGLKEFAVFSDQMNSWVKNYPNKSYLMPSSAIFEVEPAKTGKLTVKSSQDPVVACQYNILVFEKRYSFCFEPVYYYFLQDLGGAVQPLNKERFKIQSIFHNFSLIDLSGQSIKFTFNYKGYKFVMMTSQFVYVFDYRDFEVLKLNMTIRFLDKHGSKRTLNCLFESSPCSRVISSDQVDEVQTGSTTTTTSGPDFIETRSETKKAERTETDAKPSSATNWTATTVVDSQMSQFYKSIWFICLLLLLALLGLLYLLKRFVFAKKLTGTPSALAKPDEPMKPVVPVPSGSSVPPVASNQLKSLKSLQGSSKVAIKQNLNPGKSLANSKTSAVAKKNSKS